MNRHLIIKTITAIAAIALLAWGTAAAGSHTQTLKGAIAALDIDHNSVVVDVPVGDQKLSVGGPVADDARLRKNGRTADLDAFKVGDRVAVSWQRTDKGILIHRLESRN